MQLGLLSDKDCMATIHDALDAQHVDDSSKDETSLRRVVMPFLKVQSTNYRQNFAKDSCVNAICYGAILMVPGSRPPPRESHCPGRGAKDDGGHGHAESWFCDHD